MSNWERCILYVGGNDTADQCVLKSCYDELWVMINYIRTRSTCKIGVKYHTCIQVFHTLNGNEPGYSNDLFQFALNSHYSLRSAKNKSLRQLKPNTECYRTCFMYNGCKLWNSLPVSIRDATSTSVF